MLAWQNIALVNSCCKSRVVLKNKTKKLVPSSWFPADNIPKGDMLIFHTLTHSHTHMHTHLHTFTLADTGISSYSHIHSHMHSHIFTKSVKVRM